MSFKTNCGELIRLRLLVDNASESEDYDKVPREIDKTTSDLIYSIFHLTDRIDVIEERMNQPASGSVECCIPTTGEKDQQSLQKEVESLIPEEIILTKGTKVKLLNVSNYRAFPWYDETLIVESLVSNKVASCIWWDVVTERINKKSFNIEDLEVIESKMPEDKE